MVIPICNSILNIFLCFVITLKKFETQTTVVRKQDNNKYFDKIKCYQGLKLKCSLSFQQAKVEELVREQEPKIKMKFLAIFSVAVVLLASESLALFK